RFEKPTRSSFLKKERSLNVELIQSYWPEAGDISIFIQSRLAWKPTGSSIQARGSPRPMSKLQKSEEREERVLAKLREICLALPGAREVRTWGHPTFQAGKKSFAVLEQYNGHLCICFKATLALQQLLIEDPRFFK